MRRGFSTLVIFALVLLYALLMGWAVVSLGLTNGR